MGLAAAWFGGPFERSAITGFGGGFGNTVLLGIPLVLTAFGDEANLPLFLMVAFHSTLQFTGITVVIEVGRGSRASLRELPGRSRPGSPATRCCGACSAASRSASRASSCRPCSSASRG